MNSAGCLARSIAARTSAIRVVTPVDVSLWTMHTALTRCSRSAASFSSTSAGSTPCRQSPGTNSISIPSFPAICRHKVANCPVSNISTLSPGDSVLTSAASHAPVPDDGYITTVPWVWNTRFIPATISLPSAENSGPRWSIVGNAIACSTRSGTLVGPGICRKCRPVWAVAVFFIHKGSAADAASVAAKCHADKHPLSALNADRRSPCRDG